MEGWRRKGFRRCGGGRQSLVRGQQGVWCLVQGELVPQSRPASGTVPVRVPGTCYRSPLTF